MIGNLIGVFGSNPEVKSAFLSSIAKKNESEGIIVYQRNEGGKKYSFLDDDLYPEKVQGYARIASIADHAYYIFPKDGKLTASDGELAILMDSFGLKGEVQVIDGSKDLVSDTVKSSFKGLELSDYQINERSSKSSVLDLSRVEFSNNYPADRTLVYIDRAFNVKGVGVVVLGFVLCGKVSVHDRLRLLPSDTEKFAEIKGIQVSDEDQETTQRGLRVGLSLKGVDLKDLSKTSWMDDGTFSISSSIEFDFQQSQYYRPTILDRDLHIESNGELMVSRITRGTNSESRVANLQSKAPFWKGMRVCVIDLNSRPLRVVGGGIVRA